MSSGLRIADDLELPIDMVTEPIGILANRGRGKSYSTHVLVEEIHGADVPVVVLDVKGDWWGLRSSADGQADGLPFYIFGGDHADLPLEPTAGELLADLVVDERVSVVLDLSHMSKTKARAFTVAFAERLYHRNRDPLFVVVDEADVLIPQRATAETARLLGAMEDIAKRGRGRGIGMAVVTQRPQEVAKSVLDLMDTLLLLGVTGPRSLKSISEWISGHVDEDTTAHEVMATLPSLPVGTAWVWSPMQGLLQRVAVRRIRTFDSHATPKPGQKRVAPGARAALDLQALGERITATVEKAKADDPKHLHRRIAELERDLAAERSKPAPAPTVERVEVHVVPDETLEVFSGLAGQLLEQLATIDGRLTAAARVPTPLPSRPRPAADRAPTTRRRARPAGGSDTRGGPTPAAGQGAPSGDVRLRAGAHRMVEALGRMAPLRLTKSQWGTVAKLKTSGGTWSTYLSDIRRAGLIDETAAGYTLTDAGFDYLGGRPEPMTAAELQDHYRGILRSGAVSMLDALIEAYPDPLTRDELGEAVGLATSGGTFSTYLSDLVRNGLAERQDGAVVATTVLMHGADQ
ncbi:DUF87 domain-containing protein [Nocardioides sp. SOB77]|uniref:DUF87 domain-containing protein n=1 Tax=Nocardioides oceani TaxID=3058369 RepID=A0ABT8FJL4_9ACTN|nr:DUF87 domain-containing protein [Nocardioides oceani]MDN4174714.1 DUF87 domain-containing protein [Nocardioides oceani]